MSIEKAIIPTVEEFEKIIDICSKSDRVRTEVLKNHNNNLWWPLKVKDWRIRMLVSGLSTRVSYRMVHKYIYVVDRLNDYSYEEVKTMSEKKFREIVKPIGLQDSRVAFWQSIISFFEMLENEGIVPDSLSHDEFVELIQHNVQGAGYKVAQCCVLYARGYYCGVMPVDSGMKDMLGLCLGFSYPKSGAISHEIFRKQLEKLTKEINCKEIANKNNFLDLEVPDLDYLTWWTHLVLIYFKRYYCNLRNYSLCPLRKFNNNQLKIGKMCFKENPQYGGNRLIIFEGIDGVGKTTVIKKLSKLGIKTEHFDYNKTESNLNSYYEKILNEDINSRIAFDRSFISERVYGKVLRGESRITDNQNIALLKKIKKHNGILVYLFLKKEKGLKRLEAKDKEIISENYDELHKAYEDELRTIEEYLPVIKIDMDCFSIDDILNQYNIK